jgi:8-oxo-dGTP pyrophosphatase MutT (NUDIX family)
LINSLQSRLINQSLPGEQAHSKMAHAVRKVDPHPDVKTTRNAAVLIVLYEKNPGDFHLIFIRRTSTHDGDKHSGQIAFPGGKQERSDPDLMYTALREAHEEIALDMSQIDILGPITSLYITVSKFLVHPFLAYSHTVPVLLRQESEIEEVLELPLNTFMVPEAKQQTRIRLATGIILNHVPCFQINGTIIWGATAMIMNEVLELVREAGY